MTQEQKHTPEKWTIDPLDPELNNEKDGVAIIDDCGVIQARACDIETAEEILNAVNSHAHNKQTIEELAKLLSEWERNIPRMNDETPSEASLRGRTLNALLRAGVKV